MLFRTPVTFLCMHSKLPKQRPLNPNFKRSNNKMLGNVHINDVQWFEKCSNVVFCQEPDHFVRNRLSQLFRFRRSSVTFSCTIDLYVSTTPQLFRHSSHDQKPKTTCILTTLSEVQEFHRRPSPPSFTLRTLCVT